VHAVWYLEFLDWPVKRVADAQGFVNSEALANYLYRHLGARPSLLRQRFGCGQLMDAFAARWRRPQPKADRLLAQHSTHHSF
jgi:hypothetical protein